MNIMLTDELLDWLAEQYMKYNSNKKVDFEIFVNNILWLFERKLKG